MTPLQAGSPLDLGYRTPRKRALWKWSIGITAVILTFYAWQCGSTIMLSRKLANGLVGRFHEELNSSQFEEISREADEEFRHEQSVKLLGAVHDKLGYAGAESLVNITVNAGTDGAFVIGQYKTAFARGSAMETFTWVKREGTLKLYRYSIESDLFLSN